ncbi:MAG: hypothetical protein U9N07_02955 [Euryarchaeota archaeon]|nr:hypothetical protein [Euryarchaeota archaeon]
MDAGKIRELSQANDNPNIAFTDDPEEIGSADFVIIAVPTPVTKSKDPDLSCIESAARTIGTHLKPGAIVVLESTVYPGVTEEVMKPNFLRKNLVKPSDIPLRSSRIIALVNELSLIFGKMGLSTTDVLEAAGTKWNFHRYSPGLVGGHCIPVDPYYLVHRAKKLGYHPQVILAGRAINDSMPAHVAGMMIRGLNEAGNAIKAIFSQKIE